MKVLDARVKADTFSKIRRNFLLEDLPFVTTPIKTWESSKWRNRFRSPRIERVLNFKVVKNARSSSALMCSWPYLCWIFQPATTFHSHQVDGTACLGQEEGSGSPPPATRTAPPLCDMPEASKCTKSTSSSGRGLTPLDLRSCNVCVTCGEC